MEDCRDARMLTEVKNELDHLTEEIINTTATSGIMCKRVESRNTADPVARIRRGKCHSGGCD